MTQPTQLDSSLPAFTGIHPADIEPQLRRLLDEHRSALNALLDSSASGWNELVVPLEEMQHRLGRFWSPVGHLNAVMNNDELRVAYSACLPLLTAWYTDLGQNERLYHAYQRRRTQMRLRRRIGI